MLTDTAEVGSEFCSTHTRSEEQAAEDRQCGRSEGIKEHILVRGRLDTHTHTCKDGHPTILVPDPRALAAAKQARYACTRRLLSQGTSLAQRCGSPRGRGQLQPGRIGSKGRALLGERWVNHSTIPQVSLVSSGEERQMKRRGGRPSIDFEKNTDRCRVSRCRVLVGAETQCGQR